MIAYAVAQRTRELGVRIALGASAARVMRMVVGQGVVFALAGIAIGTGIALAGAKWIEPLLFNEAHPVPDFFAEAKALLGEAAVA